MPTVHSKDTNSKDTNSEATNIARQYYNGTETDRLYATVWGGENIHYGIYTDPEEDIHKASQRTVEKIAQTLETTVEKIAQTLETIDQNSRVIDLGAGYGGAARYLAKTYNCSVCCLNLSEVQNQRNRQLNQEQNLSHLIEVTMLWEEIDVYEPMPGFDPESYYKNNQQIQEKWQRQMGVVSR